MVLYLLMRFLISWFLILNTIPLLGQYYQEHYIAASPWQYWHNATEIVLSTYSDSVVSVIISKSDGSFVAQLNIRSNAPVAYRPEGVFSDFPRHPINTIIDGAGMHFQGTAPFSVNIRNIASDQLGTDIYIKGNASLTSLGDSGIGNEFRVGYYRTGGLPREAPIYSILALKDGTTIQLNNVVETKLNKGQSYLFSAPIGSLVESSNEIIMNTGAFLDAPGGCGDGTFDQIPPVQVLGERYFIVRTRGNTISEQSTLISTEENTEVWIDRYDPFGSFVSSDTITMQNAGDFYTMQNGDGVNTFSVAQVQSNNNIGVFTGSAQSCEVDVGTSFPISSPCHGSNFIETIKFKTYRKSDLPYFCYILLENDTAIVNLNGANLESLVAPRWAVGSTGMYMLTFTSNQIGNPDIITLSSTVRLNVVIIQMGGGFSMSASFSNLIEQPTIKQPISILNDSCPLISTRLTTGSSSTDIQWFFDGVEIPGAQDTFLIVTQSGVYHLQAYLECGELVESRRITVTLDTIPKSTLERVHCGPIIWNDSVYSESGSYSQIIKTKNGCDSLSILNLEIYSLDTTYLDEQSCKSFIWNDSVYSESGSYSQIIKTENGCDSLSILNLEIYSLDTTYLNEQSCSPYIWNDSVYSESGSYSQIIKTENGCDSLSILRLEIYSLDTTYLYEQSCYPPDTGQFILSVQSKEGCDSIIITHISLNAQPRLEIAGDTVLCEGETTTLRASGANQYTWSTGEFTSTIQINKAGQYIVEGINTYGCKGKDTLNIFTPTLHFNLESFPPICPGDNNGVIRISDYIEDHNYYINHQKIDTEKIGLSPGSYLLELVDKNGCKKEETVVFNEPVSLNLRMPDSLSGYVGNKIEINPNVNLKLNSSNWKPPTHLTCDTCFNTEAIIQKTGWLYYLWVTDYRGCKAIDSISIKGVLRNIYVPNVFSPNGDLLNDKFTLYTNDGYEIIEELKIFSRWGELLYVDLDLPFNDPIYGWNGVFNGDPMNPGVYGYVARVLRTDGITEILYGDVTLTR